MGRLKNSLQEVLGKLPWFRIAITFGIVFWGIGVIGNAISAILATNADIKEARLQAAMLAAFTLVYWTQKLLAEERLRRVYRFVTRAQQDKRETDKKLQAVIHVLERLDNETLEKHGITIERSNDKTKK